MGIERLSVKSLLYISNDTSTFKELQPSLDTIFKTIFYENNASMAFENFFGENRSDDEIDLVLFDMEATNLKELEKIRNKNSRIPIFVTSSHFTQLDTSLILQQKIYSSFEKPIDIQLLKTKMYDAIKEVATRKFSAYSHRAALVTRLDLQGNFIYVNEFFTDISGFEKSEVIGKSLDIIHHPKASKSIYTTLFGNLKEGKNWQGTLRHLTKENEDFYVNATIFPIFNSRKEPIEYLNISFIVTKEEQNMTKLKRYILDQKSVQMQQQQNLGKDIQNKIDNALKNERLRFQELKKITTELDMELTKLKSTKSNLSHKVVQLEDEIKAYKDKETNVDATLKQKLRDLMTENYDTYKKNEKLEHINEKFQEKLEKSQASIKVLQEYIDEYRKKIANLEDVIELREKELKEKR